MKTITILFLLLPIFAFSQSKVEDIQTIKTANSTIDLGLITDPTGLELISEEGKNGWRLIGFTGNIFIGYQAAYNDNTDNKLYIENSNSATPLIYGVFDNDLIKINGDLTVTGKVIFTNSSSSLSATATGTQGEIV